MWPLSRLAGWLRSPSAEQRTKVAVDDAGVSCVRPDGRVDAVAWSDLRSIAVETNAGGPFIEDVYFHLEGSEYSFYVPQSAAGTDPLVDRLLALPGFDAAAFSAAMTCTDAAWFPCWQRPAESGTSPSATPRD